MPSQKISGISPFDNSTTISAGDLTIFHHSPHNTHVKTSDLNPTWNHDGSIPRDGYRLFHYSYDKDDPGNGDVFTSRAGSGHYTKYWVTAPSSHGFSGTENWSHTYNLSLIHI